ncbi:hypothetical protein [Paenibacillus bovis]|uniref:Uncharacterized protein n=1 Tax=Paenibacillus bovis TaxID=1616788 RepID=A0A172ZB15_9BACL|nr:hypothetical protein [Paenibacillus bovis]ANF94808.1 hypothetical protein AR543_01340 [Paenibacillus bovis]
MYTQNINEMLLNHFANADKVAGYIRGKIPNLTEKLEEFFETRSDIKRIQLSENICERILNLTDFSDIIPIRSEVATLEIKRRIDYKKQSDHTAHTLYLFLLGIWVYDNIPQLREKIDKSIDSQKPIKMFLFQWTFASLLHDIGYLFYNFGDGSNIDSWRVYDEIFNSENLMKYIENLNENEKEYFEKICNDFNFSYKVNQHSEKETPKLLIEELENIPWLHDFGIETSKGLEILDGRDYGLNSLSYFAYEMAEKGYDGKTPIVDHGIASSLMLLKYTSAWYHIINVEDQEKLLNGKFKYYLNVFSKHVIPACRAVAYHNVPNVKFTLKTPLLYLAVLCDELQVWDRFLSGSQHIDNWRSVEHCMAEDIIATLSNDDVNNPLLNLSTSSTHYNKIVDSLSSRVDGWEQFVSINKKS